MKQMRMTLVLIGLNIVLFAYMVSSGTSMKCPSATSLVKFGALTSYHLADGEYWRLISSLFMSFNVEYLFFNLCVLYCFGRALERHIGSRFLILNYFLTGVLSTLVSIGVHADENLIYAGPIGAIFAMIGMLAAFLSVELFSKKAKLKINALALALTAYLIYKYLPSGLDLMVAGFCLGVVMGYVQLLFKQKKSYFIGYALVLFSAFGVAHHITSTDPYRFDKTLQTHRQLERERDRLTEGLARLTLRPEFSDDWEKQDKAVSEKWNEILVLDGQMEAYDLKNPADLRRRSYHSTMDRLGASAQQLESKLRHQRFLDEADREELNHIRKAMNKLYSEGP